MKQLLRRRRRIATAACIAVAAFLLAGGMARPAWATITYIGGPADHAGVNGIAAPTGAQPATTLPAPGGQNATMPSAAAPAAKSGSAVDLSGDAADSDIAGLQPVIKGDVTYVTGGIGEDERKALEAMKKDYNLHVINADRSGAFAADVVISIHGDGVDLAVSGTGPLFYAKLPPGAYTISATCDGQQQKKQIRVTRGKPLNLLFSW
ncbi:MAG TPA: hypothetical protein VMV79_06770 [Alphaproteobacteria bacterium]|nr:hypothetical protein [Alphaproteobacteria bacterium]